MKRGHGSWVTKPKQELLVGLSVCFCILGAYFSSYIQIQNEKNDCSAKPTVIVYSTRR